MAINKSELTAVGERPQDLLEEFAENWKVDGDVANAEIVDVHDETATRHKHMKLQADESVERNAVIPESTYEREVSERRPLDDRYSSTPMGESGSAKFIEHGKSPSVCSECRGDGHTRCSTCEGQGRSECSKCNGTSHVKCSSCRGDGTVSCSKCGGEGMIGNDGNESQCPKCAGSGEVQCADCAGSGSTSCEQCSGTGQTTCDDCGGSGETTCEICEGDGHVVEATRGEISFTYQSDNTYETDRVPERHVSDTAGEKVDSRVRTQGNEPELGGDSLYREQIATYEIPATTVEYAYDGDNYEFYAIEDEVTADSYPKSGTRQLLTLVGIGLGIAALVAVLYYLGYVPV